jgi:hypothetical protein
MKNANKHALRILRASDVRFEAQQVKDLFTKKQIRCI